MKRRIITLGTQGTVFFINHCVAICMFSYLAGILFIIGAPPLQVFGPDPLRIRLVTWLVHTLRIDWVLATHLAGSVLDYKKVMSYLGLLLVITCFRLVAGRQEGKVRKYVSAARFEELIRAASFPTKLVQALLCTITLVMFAEVQILPSIIDTTLGPKGVGMISTFSRSDLHLIQQLAIFLYRLSALPVYFGLYIAASLTLPLYAESSFRRIPPSPSGEAKRDESEEGAAALQVLVIPVVVLLIVAVLWAFTNAYGVGGVTPGHVMSVVWVDVIIVCVFLLLGIINWLRHSVNTADDFKRMWDALRRVSLLQQAGIVVLALLIYDALIKRHPDPLEVYHGVILNRAIEYCDWEMNKGRDLLTTSRAVVDTMFNVDGRKEIRNMWNAVVPEFESKGLENSEELAQMLASAVATMAMFIDLYEDNESVRSASNKREGNGVSGLEYLIDRGAADLESTLAIPEGEVERLKCPGLYTPKFLEKYRVTTLANLARNFQEQGLSNVGLSMFALPSDDVGLATKMMQAGRIVQKQVLR